MRWIKIENIVGLVCIFIVLAMIIMVEKNKKRELKDIKIKIEKIIQNNKDILNSLK